jgi:acetylornithine aminotransferase
MHAIMNTYGRLPVTFTSGQGSWLTDSEGKQYLDALSGIAVCGLGHAHPAVTKALCEQADKLIHTSNLYGIERQQALAEALRRVSGMDNVFFSNSGAEANEAAIKIARKYGHDQGIHEAKIVVMSQSFHGRTLATLSATGNAKVHEGFGPLVSGFVRVPYNDIDALSAVVKADPQIVAVLLEPVQGEGGLATASADYLKAVRALCDERNLLMMLDEIQTGNGRTGSYFCYQQFGFYPDVLTTAKGLGNGVPIGACLARGKASQVLQPGNHGSTYGGNPLACAAGFAVVETIEQQNLSDNAARMGDYLRQRFSEALNSSGKLKEIRGRGLMIGLVMNQDCPQLMAQAVTEQQLLLNVTAGNVIRLLPPLNLNQNEADQIVERVVALVDSMT